MQLSIQQHPAMGLYGEDSRTAGVLEVGKRQAQSQWVGMEGEMDDSAEVDMLNRLVKRCRCNDDTAAPPTPQSPGNTLMCEAP